MQSCDTGSVAELINNSDEQIEFSMSGTELVFNSGNAIFSRMESNRYYYTLDAQKSDILFDAINEEINVNVITTDTLVIYTSTDTIRLNSKEEILDRFERKNSELYELEIN